MGHHWAYRREAGEPQITFNYVRALSDWLTNFTFSNGITFESPEAYQHIVPALLDRIWSKDNDKLQTLWTIGNAGSVQGDSFVKIAYDAAYVDPAGNPHPGKVRLLPLNASFCFPSWHPHDRERLIRFKLKYRFWGDTIEGTRQVHTYVEIMDDEWIEEYVDDQLIRRNPNPMGFIPVVHIANKVASASPWGLSDVIDVIPLNRDFNEKATEISDIVNYSCVDEETEALTQDGWKKFYELTSDDSLLSLSPDTDTIEWNELDDLIVSNYSGELVQWSNHIDALTTPNHRWLVEKKFGRPVNRQYHRQIGRTSISEDGDIAISELQGKIVAGGGLPSEFRGAPVWDDEIVETVGWYVTEGCDAYAGPNNWHSATISQKREEFIPDINRLQNYWLDRGATFSSCKKNNTGSSIWYLGKGVKEVLEEVSPQKSLTPEFLCSLTYNQALLLRKVLLDGDGHRDGSRSTWGQESVTRKDSYQMLCAMLGIRTNQLEHCVTEYQRRNLDAQSTVKTAETVQYDGKIWCPVVKNTIWLARRNGITYWTGNTAPVTIITGASAANLEKSANKIWSLRQKDATVNNLSSDFSTLGPAVDFLQMLKLGMHEMIGIPEAALGTAQAISNTSGVALAIQYMPAMHAYKQKKIQYERGIIDISVMALKTLFLSEPETLVFNPNTEGIMQEPDQTPVIDPHDPAVYDITVVWPPPLPVDQTIKLSEIQAKQALGLESNIGALRDLGVEFPDEKFQEIFEEKMVDLEQEAAMQIRRAIVAAYVQKLTGLVPEGYQEQDDKPKPGEPGKPKSAMDKTSTSGILPQMPSISDITGLKGTNVMSNITTMAYGTKLPVLRSPSPDRSDQS